MTVTEVKKILKEYSIRPSRESGQNFLVDEGIAREIVEMSEVDSNPVVEIGPGLGILTKYLLERAQLVLGVEVGKRLCEFLSNRFKDNPNFILVNADFLDLDVAHLSEYGGKFKIVSNLPFSISKPAISRILRLREFIESATITVQQEVAGRIGASPGTKDYGILTVMVAYWARTEELLTIRSGSFFPRPRVDSTTIRLTMYDELIVPAVDEDLFRKVVRGAFSQRRKMLRNALAAHLNLDACKMSALEEASAIDFTRRGETLSLEEFVHLANTLASFGV